jgi:hypothetical protein
MNLSSFKVRDRLLAGFALLLIATAVIGVVGVQQLGGRNAAVDPLATRDWVAERNPQPRGVAPLLKKVAGGNDWNEC